ncbi:Smr/MutS family protein [Sphingomonas sp. GCM10030256]|uniref:Smr/MutS family protein n=1 Tax=Sphingomonas sp. GCM10030256 TaxID=3273427 RepID=UPI003608491D
MRKLSADEQELWSRVTATIRPLSREPVAAEDAPTGPPPPPIARKPKGPPPRPAAPASVRPAPRPGTTLDGGWDRRLRTGAVEPDRTLDLHGHNLDSAWTAIDRALEQAIDAGDRMLLLITGHARVGEPPVERGRIRAAVHDWLAVSRHASRIAAVRNAHRRHGGGGSLYLILRR